MRDEPSPHADGAIDLVVVGAHLTGMPLNHELTALGGRLIDQTSTTPDYRLFELAGARPSKPGMLRVKEGAGARIEVEVWRLAPAAFGAFVSRIPSPLGVGTVRLDDGRRLKGFLVEAIAVEGARDVSDFGGWRAYCASLVAD